MDMPAVQYAHLQSGAGTLGHWAIAGGRSGTPAALRQTPQDRIRRLLQAPSR